jgi:hypothetical protein
MFPESHIAIKSSEKDDIEGIDLFANDCEIRYIITKQALQEGWDCSFAYVLNCAYQSIICNRNYAVGRTNFKTTICTKNQNQRFGRVLCLHFPTKCQAPW